MDPEYPYIPSYSFATGGAVITSIDTFKDHGDSYEATNENPRVFCSYGPTPTAALRAMASLLRKEGIDTWKASSVHFDEEGTHFLTIYV